MPITKNSFFVPNNLHVASMPARIVVLHTFNTSDGFTSMHNRYLPLIRKYIRILSNSNQEAEDISQDIFLKLWERRDKLSGISSMGDYIFIMVKNRVNELRKKELRLTHALGNMMHGAPAPANIHDALLSRKAEQLYNTGLRSLPPRARTAYVLKKHEGLTIRSIAGRMSITESTAKQQVHAAGKRLRQYIASWYD